MTIGAERKLVKRLLPHHRYGNPVTGPFFEYEQLEVTEEPWVSLDYDQKTVVVRYASGRVLRYPSNGRMTVAEEPNVHTQPGRFTRTYEWEEPCRR